MLLNGNDVETVVRIQRRDTLQVLQEKGNLYLYEKMGYHQTGKVEHINDQMDIVFMKRTEK